MDTIKDIDYLFISTRVHALERNLLSKERMTRMLEAPSLDDAVKVLPECGYPELIPLDDRILRNALAEEQHKTFSDLAALVPEPALIDVFRVKYDYHNVKVLLKAEVTGADPLPILTDAGRVKAKELHEKVLASDFRGIPAILQSAIVAARETLGTTSDPQLSDFVLDRAYFEDMRALAVHAQSSFLEGYVRILIDAANLRTAIRTQRMGKNSEFLKEILFHGGNIDASRIQMAAGSGGSLPELFAVSPLHDAAEAGAATLNGGRLTNFERLCDNAVSDYLKGAKYVAFGEAPVIAYLAAKENEFTAIRIILSGRMAGLPSEIISERLRDSYV
ncbi:MAG: V-type ATPase subunit [Evtepia sp.]